MRTLVSHPEVASPTAFRLAPILGLDQASRGNTAHLGFGPKFGWAHGEAICPSWIGPVANVATSQAPWRSLGYDFTRIAVDSPDVGALQLKLAGGDSADPFEQEANLTADKVMRMPDAPRGRPNHHAAGSIRDPMMGQGATPSFAGTLLATPGEPLHWGARAYLEPRFGHDFSRVRVHADSRAVASAQSLNALAFTVGNHIVFNAGQYHPHGSEGRRLLAHELTHVLQQGSGRGFGLVQRQVRPGGGGSTSENAMPPYRHAWENPALLATIYPARETMLRRFVAMYHEIELQALSEAQRGAVIQRVRAQIQAEVARLESLPAPTRADRARIVELQRVLRRGMIRGERAWESAVAWERRSHGQSLSGDALVAEVRRLFGTGLVPEWLQPLVLDYAGMRYRSAHGSYYSPVRLLHIMDDAQGAADHGRAAQDGGAFRPGRGTRRDRPRPAVSESAIRTPDPAAAAQELVRRHRTGLIPDWVWRQVVRDTELRVPFASADWEAASAPPAERSPQEVAFWQGVLRRWRGAERIGTTGTGSTGWRAELYRRHALLTTRMVCNELAEAAARQRGVRLPGGIRGDADYYFQQAEHDTQPQGLPQTAGAYFRNPRGPADFVPGAGLFFVKGTWQSPEPGPHAKVIARAGLTYPNIMSAEENSIQVRYRTEMRTWEGRPAATRGDAPSNPFAGRPETLPPDGAVVDGWTYHVAPGEAIHRTRDNETQWMAWSHEATVIQRIDSRVFTLETTDSGGGPQSEGGNTGGASGFRTRRVSDLLRPGVFVGYRSGNNPPPIPAQGPSTRPSAGMSQPPATQLTPAEADALTVGRR